MMRKFLVLSIVMFMICSTVIFANADLDPNFGQGGYVTIDDRWDENQCGYLCYPKTTAIDEQGRTLVVASVTTIYEDVYGRVFRLNKDGSLDRNFGANGFVYLGSYVSVADITLYNNKIYIVGSILQDGSAGIVEPIELAVWRLSENGELENAEDGKPSYRFDTFAGREKARAIVSDGAGNMYVTGDVYDGSPMDDDFLGSDMALWRFNVTDSNFELDTSFADKGLAIHNGAAGGADIREDWYFDDKGLYIQLHDNKIWVAGNSSEKNDLHPSERRYYQDIVIWSFDLNGEINHDFNDVGYVVVGNEYKNGSDDPADSYYAKGFAIDKLGRFVLAGVDYSSEREEDKVDPYGLATFRLNPDGKFDKTYSQDGYDFHPDLPLKIASDLMIDESNRIIVLGQGEGYNEDWDRNDLVVVRFLENGNVDSTFGVDGAFTFRSDDEKFDLGPGRIIPYRDDKAVIVGGVWYDGGRGHGDMYVWRLDLLR